jgi:hypothetical protein
VKRIVVVALALWIAGCIAEAPAAPTASTPAEPSTAPPAPVVETGLVGPNETRNESVVWTLDTTGPVTVTLRLNGTELFREEVPASRTWDVPLSYGRSTLEAEVAAPGVHVVESYNVTRLGLTKLRVDYGRYHPQSVGTAKADVFDVWIDVDSRPSNADYEKAGIKHVDTFNAHDQLVLFEALAKKDVEFAYSASFQGFTVSRIDAAGNPVSSSAPPWWGYTVNAKSANGISIQPVRPGDAVVWTLGSPA